MPEKKGPMPTLVRTMPPDFKPMQELRLPGTKE
jgi:hypothetical protein